MTELSDFVARHVGPSERRPARPCSRPLGVDSLDALIEAVVPGNIRDDGGRWRCPTASTRRPR